MIGLLARLAPHGITAPLAAVALGLSLPTVAEWSRDVLLVWIMLLLAMTVALAEPGRLRAQELPPVLALAAANLLLTPVVAFLLAEVLGLAAEARWLLLIAACPAAGSAVLIARQLGLPMRPMLLAQLLCFAALPLTAPLIAAGLVGTDVLDAGALLQRVALLVLGPALAGLAIRSVLGERRRQNAAAGMRGAAVLALTGIGLAIADGLAASLSDPRQVIVAALSLGCVSLLGAMLGSLAALGQPRRLIGAMALGGAVRNVSLLWGATAGLIPPEAELLMELGTLWTLVLPALLVLGRWLLAGSVAPSRRPAYMGAPEDQNTS